MLCTFRIAAQLRPRMLGRAIQIFDQQLLTPSSFTFTVIDDEVRIESTVQCKEALARGIAEKLRRFLGVVDVELRTSGTLDEP